MSEPKVTLAEIEDWANRSGITMPGMADTMLRAVYDEVKRLHAENERLRAIAEAIRDADDDDPVSRIKVHGPTGASYLRYAVSTALSTSTPSGTDGK